VNEFSVGLIKRKIELAQDIKAAQAKALQLADAKRTKESKSPFFSKASNIVNLFYNLWSHLSLPCGV
jgi:hypothetical protein